MWSRPRAHVRNAVVTCLTPLSAMRVFLQNWAAVEQFAQLCYNPTPSLLLADSVSIYSKTTVHCFPGSLLGSPKVYYKVNTWHPPKIPRFLSCSSFSGFS